MSVSRLPLLLLVSGAEAKVEKDEEQEGEVKSGGKRQRGQRGFL